MKKRNYWKGVIKAIIPFILVTLLFSPFFQSCQKEEIMEPEHATLKSATTVGSLTFFTTPEEFPCTGVPVEGFEKATNAYPENIWNPVDATTNTGYLPAGSILSGISITSSRDDGPYTSADLVLWAGLNSIVGHIVLSNHQQEKLIIDFSDENVTVVSMRLLTIFWSDVATFNINVYGNSDVLLGTTAVVGGTPAGTYFGVQSESPIKKITIYGFDHVHYAEVPEGIDDVMFGTCVVDSDSDGCNDADDAVVNSNMEEFVTIEGCFNNVPNKMIVGVPCGTMMSDVIDALEAAKYKNHGAFVKAVLKVVTEWYNKGLITLEEREALMICAEASSIGNKK